MADRNFLGKKKPNWLEFVVDELSFVDFPAVQEADIVALKRGKPPMTVAEKVAALKALTAEQLAAIRTTHKQGNIQDLIDTWDEWAGSFSACVSALEGKEGITDPESLCAWMEHEATGKWPAEH